MHTYTYVYYVAVPSVVPLLPVCSGYRIFLNFAGPSWTADPSYQQQLRYGRLSSSFPHALYIYVSRDVVPHKVFVSSATEDLLDF